MAASVHDFGDLTNIPTEWTEGKLLDYTALCHNCCNAVVDGAKFDALAKIAESTARVRAKSFEQLHASAMQGNVEDSLVVGLRYAICVCRVRLISSCDFLDGQNVRGLLGS